MATTFLVLGLQLQKCRNDDSLVLAANNLRKIKVLLSTEAILNIKIYVAGK
jgi:hypothetical protein